MTDVTKVQTTAQAWEAYDDAIAPAWKAYQEAKAQAWKAYEEAKAQVWEAYEEAIAPAWEAYEEAAAAARKAYEEAAAAARKAYEEATIQWNRRDRYTGEITQVTAAFVEEKLSGYYDKVETAMKFATESAPAGTDFADYWPDKLTKV